MVRSLTTLILVFCFSTIVSAQVVDDSSIEDAQNGGYTFVEGMFVAYLADTVSPGFIERSFQELNIPVLDTQIEPLVVSVVNQPSEESLAALNEHPKVLNMYTMIDKVSIERTNKLLKQQGFTEEQIKELHKESPEMTMYIIRFDYSINEKIAKHILEGYRDVAYRILSKPLKTVTLKAEVGEEPLLMDKVEQLHFVESTAMIGTIKN